MSSRAVAIAAGAAMLIALSLRPCFADVALDSWRDTRATSSWQCPERISRAAAAVAASVGDARSVRAEFINGRGGTLDLDATEGGQPRRVFRLRFPALPAATQFMVALFMNDGSSRAACVVRLPARDSGFSVDFPLAGFRQALGIADYRDVDYILLVARRADAASDSAVPGAARVLSIAVSGTQQPGAVLARCR